MFKNRILQMLVDLRKSGTDIYLTDDGFNAFLLLIHHENIALDNDNIIDQMKAM